MHTNNKIKAEQKSVVVDDRGFTADAGAARLMSYEPYDFQPGCRKRSVPAFPMQVDVAQPAQPVPSFFIKPELREDPTKTGRPEAQEDNLKTAQINPREVSVRKVKTAKEEVKTCKPEAERKDGQSEAKNPAATCVKLSNEIVRKTMDTVKQAINTLKGSKEVNGKEKSESSIKTALSISTIPEKEAEKYSFLKKDKKKPVALMTNFEEPHGSDLDLDLGTGIDDGKPKQPPRLDMKTLEAYFKSPSKCTDKKPTTPPENTDKQEKVRRSKSWTARKQKSMKLLRQLTKGSSSAEKTDKSAEEHAKVKVKRSWTKRLKRKLTHQSSPASSKQRPSKEREKSKQSLKS